MHPLQRILRLLMAREKLGPLFALEIANRTVELHPQPAVLQLYEVVMHNILSRLVYGRDAKPVFFT